MSLLNHKQFREDEGEPWYHSSKANLTPGVDQILPANDTRVGGSHYGYSKHDSWAASGWDEEETGGTSRGDFTFAADTEEEAEAWLPSKPGRPTTYVVKPPDDADIDYELHHYMTNNPLGEHIKTRGPMDIVDRIDIPRPKHEGEVVQGTLPPQNWGHLNGLPKDYTGPATVGVQHPGTDNYKRIFPAYEQMMGQNNEGGAAAIEARDRIAYRHQWKRAGQQELDL